jgi:hypothetical protein
MCHCRAIRKTRRAGWPSLHRIPAERSAGPLIIFEAVMGDHRSVRSVTLASKPGGPVSTPSSHLRSARRAPGYQPPKDLAFFFWRPQRGLARNRRPRRQSGTGVGHRPTAALSTLFSRGRRDEFHREKRNRYRRILASSISNLPQLRPVIVPWSTLHRARLGGCRSGSGWKLKAA